MYIFLQTSDMLEFSYSDVFKLVLKSKTFQNWIYNILQIYFKNT